MGYASPIQYRSLAEIFERQMIASPEKTAIIENDSKLSFAELESWSARIALHLLKHGIGKGSRVGVHLPKSAAAVASVLGILKTGAVYVPVSRSMPPERIHFCLTDASVKMVLTDEKDAANIHADFKNFDPWLLKDGPGQTYSFAATDAGDDCWILYTSGSTGSPKGVRGKHGACINRIEWMWEAQPFSADEICFQNTALTTVDSYWEILGPLGKGVPLMILPDSVTQDPAQLVKALANTNIERICLVPSLLSSMLWIYPDLGTRLPQLKLWIVSGEPLSAELCRRFYTSHPQARLINQYGLTESCADVTSYDTSVIKEQLLLRSNDQSRSIPIGRPIKNVEAYIIDGELVLSGIALSNGYLNRAKEEQERFAVMTLPGGEQRRVLKTGDIARITEDGNIAYSGRKDSQVKIRGYRVEPHEVETALLLFEGIKEVAVLPVKNEGDEIQLVCIFEHQADSVDLTAIRNWMEAKLPDYMWPARYVVQQVMPRTATGKLDKKALSALLPAISAVHHSTNEASQTIDTIKKVWCDVLKLPSIGIDDDFYASGGHSLKAAEVFARLSEYTGVTLALPEIFTLRTIRKMAERIDMLNTSKQNEIEPAHHQKPQTLIPLSAPQQRLWFIQRLNPRDASYNLGFCLLIKGNVPAGTLEKAMNMLVQRHPMLRASVQEEDGVAYFKIADAANIPFEIIEDEEVTQEQTKRWGRRPFDLQKAPLSRAYLVRSSSQQRLYIFAHHLICDGAAAYIISKDLVNAVNYVNQGRHLMPSVENILVNANGNQHRQEQKDLLLSYWINRVTAMPRSLELPRMASEKDIAPWIGDQQKIILPLQLSQNLQEFALDAGCTISTLFLAALTILLKRLTQQDCIAVILPVTTRHSLALQQNINFLTDAVLLRLDVSGALNFSTMVRRTADEVAAALNHMPMPLEELLSGTIVDRRKLRSPLADLEFTFQEKGEDIIAGDIVANIQNVNTGTCRFDISVGITRTATGFEVNVDYAADSFDAAFITAFLEYYQTLLQRLIAQPGAMVNEIDYLPESSRKKVIRTGEQLTGEHNTSIPHAFFKIVLQYPNHIALIRGGVEYTYRQLADGVSSLCAYFQQKDIGAACRVAVCLPRSAHIPMAALAILSSGGAYVLLDPQMPEARLRKMLDLIEPVLVITDRFFLHIFSPTSINVVCIEDIDLTVKASSFIAEVSWGQEATVQFTSGSTGFPKGISVTQGNLQAYRTAVQQVTGNLAGSRWLAVSSISFDIAFTELILPLTFGGTVYIADAPNTNEGDGVNNAFSLLQNKEISHLQCTPSLLRLFLEHEKTRRRLSSLEKLLVGGEALTPDLAKKILQANVRDPWNMYGPTETTVWSSACRITATDTIIHIGKPLAGESIYILDAQRQPVAPGTIGEIFIGGAGVTNGYIKDERQTALKFLPDPFTTVEGARMYGTGDFARTDAQGRIEFMGRKDFQVKIRGHRIELEDIESAIQEHPMVATAACSVQPAADNSLLIAAHVVPVEAAQLSVDELRRYLATALPLYMVPTLIAMVPALPLSIRGKIDRAALPHISAIETSDAGQVENETAYAIATIWAELLNISAGSINPSATFFSLGGHSLLATRMVSRMNLKFGIELPLAFVMSDPSLSSLSQWLTEQTTPEKNPAAPVTELQPSLNQERLWFVDRLHNGSPFLNIQAGLWINGNLNISVLQSTLDIIMQHEDVLGLSFRANENGEVAVTSDPHPFIPLQQVDLSHYNESAAGMAVQLARKAGRQAFDLGEPPLLRVSLFKIAKERWLLSVVMHHIISDAVSLQLLLKNLVKVYEQAARNEIKTLPAKRMSYLQYAAWERAQLTPAIMRAEQHFWNTALAGPLPVLRLPADYPRQPTKSFEGAQYYFYVEQDTRNAINTAANSHQCSVFVFLLSAYGVFLRYLTGDEDFVIATTVDSRRHPDVEDSVGLFVHTLALRLRVEPEKSFAEMVAKCKAGFNEAFSHQWVPFNQIISSLKRADIVGRSIFNTMMVFHHELLPQQVNFAGLTGQPVNIDLGFSQFDISLYVDELVNGFRFMFEYDTQLFKQETIVRFAEIFKTILQTCIAGQQLNSAAIPRQDVEKIVAWQNTTAPFNINAGEIFERVVAAHAQQTAIICGEENISYQQLQSQVASLSARLRHEGVEAGDIVCTLMDRSPALIVSVLAILAVGACYSPIDPNHPKNRIELVLQQANPKLLLTPYAVDAGKWKVLDPTTVAATATSLQFEPLNECARVALIFTSGSTGIPKGVFLTLGGIMNRLEWGRRNYAYKQGECCVARTPVGFVDSLAELLGPVLGGSTLRMYSDKEVRDIEHFTRAMAKDKITRAVFTPGILDAIADEIDESYHNLGSLQTIFLSGEPLQTATVKRWKKLFPASTIVNIYGCTEGCADSTYYELPANESQESLVPVGRPIANTQVLILDERLQLCPIGITGEICIAGAGLSPGYINEQIVQPSPFIELEKPVNNVSRIYKTGDYGYYRHDGVIIFRGRKGNTVKVRGIRVELSEVEAAIAASGLVKKCLVMLHEQGSGELIAAIVPAGASAQIPALHKYLRDHLPPAMVPSRILECESLPMNVNGKIDRKHFIGNILPGMLQQQPVNKPERAPEEFMDDNTGAVLRDAWMDLLKTDKVDDDSDFFLLGGHSLLAARLAARLRRSLSVDISIEAVFDHSSFHSMRKYIISQKAPAVQSTDDILSALIEEITAKENIT